MTTPSEKTPGAVLSEEEFALVLDVVHDANSPISAADTARNQLTRHDERQRQLIEELRREIRELHERDRKNTSPSAYYDE